MNYNNGNSAGRNVIRSLVIVCLVAMFMGAGYMIYEGSNNDPTSEPNKMYFGIAHLLAAAILGAMYVWGLT